MTAPLTDDELRALAEAAPKWVVDDPEPHYGEFGWYVSGSPAGETVDTEEGRAAARYIAALSPDVTLSLLDRLGRAEAALRETTQMLAYLWDAESYIGAPVREMFYDDDPLNEDVPKVIDAARAALGEQSR